MIPYKSVDLLGARIRPQRVQPRRPGQSYATLAWSGSRIDTIQIGTKYHVHVKRDDLLGDAGTGGNKARKLAYFRRTLSAGTLQKPCKSIVSTGGNQSNAMLATAHLAKDFGLDFHFFTKPLSPKARHEPSGNLAASLSLGMHLHEATDVDASIKDFLASPEGKDTLYIPRGVSCNEAEEGLAELAREIFEHFRNIAPHKNQIHVYLPSGTGTTAHFLHRNLLLLSENTGIQPYTVGVSIAMTPQNLLASVQRSHPAEPGYPIFAHPSQGRIRFAEPNARVKSMWCFMKRKGIDLDLIYGPVAWMLLFEQLPSIDHSKAEVYYVHTGGLTGNASQLKRYPKDQCKVLKQL